MSNYDLEMAPLRSLDDFLLGSAKFQLPNYKDLDKWANRVAQNLMYYQTNYFLLAICMIILFAFLHPTKMFLGGLSFVVVYSLFCYFFSTNSSTMRFKRNHPFIGILLIIGGACFMVILLGSFLVFLCGILCPFSAMFIHASLRLRNIKNKLSNFERVVSKQTPMGFFLQSVGMEPDLLS